MNEWFNMAPYILPAIGGTIIFCLGVFYKERSSNLLGVLALGVAAATLILDWWGAHYLIGLSGVTEFSGYERFFRLVIEAIVILTLLFLFGYARARDFANDELYGLVLLAGLGMSLTVSADNWVNFFVGFELLSVTLYILIAINKKEALSTEAGLKYYVTGIVAGGFLVFGLALVYSATGTMAIGEGLVGLRGTIRPLFLAAFCFVLTGLAIKLSLAPFHVWTPDVYQGAPAPITAFLSTGAKIAVLAFLARLFLYLPGSLFELIIPLVGILAALTMAVGNITALRQSRLKRRLAFSSMAQMGYLLLALLSMKNGGAEAIMFFLPVYALMDLGAFGIIGSYSAQGTDLEELKQFRGLGYLYSWRSGILSVCLLSLAGFPPTAGFIGKFLIFKSALAAGHLFLSIFGILTVIVSVYYYFEIIVVLYMHPQEETHSVAPVLFSDGAAWALTLIFIIGLGVAPTPLLSSINSILSTVWRGVGG